jgi:hypothetical protein
MTMQVVLTPANTVAHTRSLPQQLINQGVEGQPVVPQVDSVQLLQTLLNQLAISSQLNTQQPAPSASQPIEQATSFTGHSNTQGSTEARTVPDPKTRTLEEQPLETPAEIQAIEQVATELKSHMKQELIDHFSEILLKQYGIKPKQQSCMYRTLHPSGYDQISFPPRFKVPDFNKFSEQDETSTMEHITRFIIQCGEVGNVDALRIRLFSSSLLGPAFSWFTSLPANSIIKWSDLEQQFHNYFFSSINEMKITNLTSLKQRNDETLAGEKLETSVTV